MKKKLTRIYEAVNLFGSNTSQSSRNRITLLKFLFQKIKRKTFIFFVLRSILLNTTKKIEYDKFN